MNNPNQAKQTFIVEKELSYMIIGAFYESYNELGFGSLEALYAKRLERALSRRGIRVQREYPVPVFSEGEQLGFQRLDMLVEGRVIVELKSTETLAPHTWRQVRSYLAATGLQLGILLHSGPKATYKRVLNPGTRTQYSPNSGR